MPMNALRPRQLLGSLSVISVPSSKLVSSSADSSDPAISFLRPRYIQRPRLVLGQRDPEHVKRFGTVKTPGSIATAYVCSYLM